jgi:hypothetical protein
MAVHENEVFWLPTDPADMDRCLFKMPLEDLLTGDGTAVSVPEYLKGNNRFLCLVPDHWFGMECYPFRSRKPALIEAFLERKLAASHPGQKSITQFFNYQRNPAKDGQDMLYVHFLQEDTAYRFNRALHRAHLAPLGYTTPAFLWEEALQKSAPEFAGKGSLLAHISDEQARLYFYFNGIYQFSRVVVLPADASEKIGAITYEINQSLYLFSQKTKSELRQIFLFPDASDMRQNLSEALGREVMDCPALHTENQCGLAMSQVPALCGLLARQPPNKRPSVFSVIHRRIKQGMMWRPVQQVGIAVGLLVVLLLMGEGLFLGGVLQRAETEQRNLQNQMRMKSASDLTTYAQAFDQVLNRIAQPASAETILRTVAGLPANVQLKGLDLTWESPPSLAVTAVVDARDMNHLHATLADLVARMNAAFQRTRRLSINDIEVGSSPSAGRAAGLRFTIAFRLEM